MWPILLKLGPINISSFGVCLSLGFLIACFAIWRSSRDRGMEETKIFDHVIMMAVFSIIGARSYFVATHWDLFASHWLRIFAMWKFPGLSLLGAFIVVAITFWIFGKRLKLPMPILLDAYGRGLPWLMFFISLAVFLDGTVVGKPSTWWLALPAVAKTELRHPVGLYGMILALLIAIILLWLTWYMRNQEKYLDGVVGWLSLSLCGLVQLVLAFFRDDLLYWGRIAPDIVWAILLFLLPILPLFHLLEGRKTARNWRTVLTEKIRQIKI